MDECRSRSIQPKRGAAVVGALQPGPRVSHRPPVDGAVCVSTAGAERPPLACSQLGGGRTTEQSRSAGEAPGRCRRLHDPPLPVCIFPDGARMEHPIRARRGGVARRNPDGLMRCGIERLAHSFDPLDALRIQQVCRTSLDPLKALDDTGRRVREVRAWVALYTPAVAFEIGYRALVQVVLPPRIGLQLFPLFRLQGHIALIFGCCVCHNALLLARVECRSGSIRQRDGRRLTSEVPGTGVPRLADSGRLCIGTLISACGE
jgi:hypothetical protein